MAIFNTTTTTENTVTEITNEKTKLEAPTYVFESDTKLSEIVKQLSGYKWKVNYYHAVNANDDLNITLDLSTDNIIYEYNLIKDLVLFVDQPLDTTTPDELTGSAYIDASITPSPADIFISNLIDGRLGIFTITGISKETYNKRYTYKITYKLYTIIDQHDDVLLPKINSKVIEEYYYNSDYLRREDKVLLTKQDVDIRKELNGMLNNLSNMLNKYVITPDTRYLYATNLEGYGLIYDPFIEEVLLRTFEISDITPRYTPLQVNNVERFNNIINSMITDNKYILDKYTRITTALEYNDDPKIFSLIYTGIDYLIMTDREQPPVSVFIYGYEGYKPIRLDSYIFDIEFYDYLSGNNNEYVLDNMEYCVASIINKTNINYDRLRSFYEDALNMNHNQLYYCLPILAYTIKYVLLNNQAVTTL